MPVRPMTRRPLVALTIVLGLACSTGQAGPPRPFSATTMDVTGRTEGFSGPSADPLYPGLCPGETSLLPASPLVRPSDPRLQDDRLIVVLKEKRRLMLFSKGRLFVDPADRSVGCWPIALGVSDDGLYPPGPKLKRGDRKTPEGWYRTADRPQSSFYHAIVIYYPNAQDAALALIDGLIDRKTHNAILDALTTGRKPPQDTPLGGDVLIHGGGSSPDWTLGCVALDNHDIDDLRSHLPKGMKTELLILP
jgi:hypothetical protein